MKFHALIEGAGKTAAGIEVPAEVVTALGHTKKPPVRVTINGYTYRSTVATVGGRFMVGVSNEVRTNAGVAAGEEVDVEMELDTAPREVVVPPELAQELARRPRRPPGIRGAVVQQAAPARGPGGECEDGRDPRSKHRQGAQLPARELTRAA